MQEMQTSSTPTFSEFNPHLIPYQYRVIEDLTCNFDYSKGVHEILLSGSVGCLREDALVRTAFGEVPISNITERDYLVTYHERSNQFGLTRGSGAFPKGKGNLYRVVNEHGEFVANEHHLIATSFCNYERVGDLFSRSSLHVLPHVQYSTNHEEHQKLLVLCVLHYYETVVNLINHCVVRIHQCGLQLPQDLEIFLNAFPLLNDVQEYGLFFYNYKLSHMDDFRVQELKLDHNAESTFRLSMLDFFRNVENKNEDEVDVYSQDDSKSCVHILHDNLVNLLCHSHDAHPRDLLFFLSKFCNILYQALTPPCVSITNCTHRIEKVSSNDWYWDMKVPNTNNYLCNGLVHHNSAKSILMAHLAILHCLSFPKARGVLGRKAMPDLKDTILQKIIDHMYGDLIEDVHYQHNPSTGKIVFYNGSEIRCRSWADKRYRKFRSLDLSFAIIEELTENNSEEFNEFYKEIYARVGRLPHIKQNFVMCATNPDSPSHSAYDYFIASKSPNRHVYYSVTTDNPFLPKTYVEQLLKTYTKQEARRMIYGEWVEIRTEVIYYAFNEDKNVIDDYKINEMYPVIITFDFNIGVNKPMSACLLQFIDGKFYVFAEVIINGSNTLEICEEMIAQGFLDLPVQYIINGDASGRAKSSKYNRSDYDIIKHVFESYSGRYGQPQVTIDIPLSNPPVRKRHIVVNGQLENYYDQSNLFITKKCPTVIKGLRLAKLKKGAGYIEDDSESNPWQHVTTALGYSVVRQLDNIQSKQNFYQGGLHGDQIRQGGRYFEPKLSQADYRRYRGR